MEDVIVNLDPEEEAWLARHTLVTVSTDLEGNMIFNGSKIASAKDLVQRLLLG